jgi:hypothetical protein
VLHSTFPVVEASIMLKEMFPDNARRDSVVKTSLSRVTKGLGKDFADIRERLKVDPAFVINLIAPV